MKVTSGSISLCPWHRLHLQMSGKGSQVGACMRACIHVCCGDTRSFQSTFLTRTSWMSEPERHLLTDFKTPGQQFEPLSMLVLENFSQTPAHPDVQGRASQSSFGVAAPSSTWGDVLVMHSGSSRRTSQWGGSTG